MTPNSLKSMTELLGEIVPLVTENRFYVSRVQLNAYVHFGGNVFSPSGTVLLTDYPSTEEYEEGGTLPEPVWPTKAEFGKLEHVIVGLGKGRGIPLSVQLAFSDSNAGLFRRCFPEDPLPESHVPLHRCSAPLDNDEE